MLRFFRVADLTLLIQSAVNRRALGLGLCYFLFGKIGLALAFIPPSVTLIWLPSGIAVAALIRWGGGMSLAIFLGAFLLNLSTQIGVLTALEIAAGNTLAALATWWILKQRNFGGQFQHREDVVHFCIASALGMAISASLGSHSLWLAHLIDDVRFTWFSWWAGDVVGCFLAAPLLFAANYKFFARMRIQSKELTLFTVIFWAAHWMIFFAHNRLLHLTFVAMTFVIWSALRLGSFVSSLTVLLSSALAGIATYQGLGPFQSLERSESLMVLWLYMASLSVTALTIAALQAERNTAADHLQDAFERINKVASRLPGMIMQYRAYADHSVKVLYVSDAVNTLLEVSPQAINAQQATLRQRIDPRDHTAFLEAIQLANDEVTPYQVAFRFHRTDGQVRWLNIDAIPEQEPDDNLLWHCFVSDITDRKNAEQDLRIAASTFESQEGIFVADDRWQVLKINHAYTRITGFTSEDMLGKRIPRLFNTQQDLNFFKSIDQALIQHRYWQGELWSERQNGEVYPQLITLTAVLGEQAEISHYIGSFTDISRHKGYEEEILNLAFYDSLTHLPNRRLLMDRLQHLIALNQRDTSHSAILFIDLDNFKTLNDTRGHDAGDLLLLEAARRLQTCVRESDTVARLGGDEFVVVLQSLSAVSDEAALQADRIAEKIRALLNEPYQITDFVHHASGSIGVCLFQGGDITVEDLFKRADTAMYEAKTSGRNAVQFFDPAMQAVLVVKMMLESNLRVALALEQFQLHYQVQVDADGRVVGAEALLRWNHPDRGYISPLEFIPLAEQTGLIVPIGTWVMETACAQLKKWSEHPKTARLCLAVNVSAKQFQQANFVQTVTDLIYANQFEASHLKIELTETTVLDNVDATTAKMHELRKLGVVFSMDDFGTGYSSLAYLQKLPLNQIKIDQSFIRDLNDDESDATIVRSIIALGNNLGLDVIAEGVETVAQRRFLIEHNCLTFQGYLYSKPIPVEELDILLGDEFDDHHIFFLPPDAGG